jgi:hypothetical protein
MNMRSLGLTILFFIQLARAAWCQEEERSSLLYQPWRMHHIRDDYLIANSADTADVNGDGFQDLAVIDESIGLETIVFHPGSDGDVCSHWPRVVLGKTSNPEYSCLGDLDGDGNMDLIVVEGDDLEKGNLTGVRVFWGPEKSAVMDPLRWVDAGHIPKTDGRQYLYAQCHDVNVDGATDIIVGGRRHSVTKEYAGLMWIEAPITRDNRRKLELWTIHYVDRDSLSGHAWVITDVDQDGDKDIIDANADWDTSERDEELYWYENPGDGTDAQKQEWIHHCIWKSTEFYAKPQIGLGDVDGDGLVDLCTQTQNSMHLFRKTNCTPVEWVHSVIPKPDLTQWIGRPVKMADLNGDDELDLVGMLIHNDGNLPKDKASVFWMEHESGSPWTQWKTHVIKMSDGYNSRQQWVGEKWDHCLCLDVDRDGDTDILGNVEEHYRELNEENQSFFSLVWFENPLK